MVLAETGAPGGGASNDDRGVNTRSTGGAGGQAAEADNHWRSYWAEACENPGTAQAEARDHVDRLDKAIAIRQSDHVLDFGCGFGHAARLLAGRVHRLALWDQSEGILDAASRRLGDCANVYAVDLSKSAGQRSAGPFDLILAHSVVQYMTEPELGGWLVQWRSMLSPGGRIILSDIPVAGSSALIETVGLIGFAVRHRVLRSVLAEGARALSSYVRTRKRMPLLHLDPARIAALAAAAGLAADVLRENLGHRRRRLSVQFTALAAGPRSGNSSKR